MIPAFNFAPLPTIHFGVGQFQNIGSIASESGHRPLVLTGEASLKATDREAALFAQLADHMQAFFKASIKTEPSPQIVDRLVDQYRDSSIDMVIAVGGGSVLDAGKAIAAMLKCKGSVKAYLEGVGTQKSTGAKVPFIAIPTTSGTGSEATKNAVIAQVGEEGFKKSLRHANYIPDVAVIDPELMLKTPVHITASCGMDALSQLVESYVSVTSNPMTDALALSGIEAVHKSLVQLCTSPDDNLPARTRMAYAALISGITLANAGLGVVHGIAGPIGGLFPIPHGVACGTLLAESMRTTIVKLKEEQARHPDHAIYLQKFATLGRIMGDCERKSTAYCCDLLIETLEKWTQILEIPRLGGYGIGEADVAKIVARSSNKHNPCALTKSEMAELLRKRI